MDGDRNRCEREGDQGREGKGNWLVCKNMKRYLNYKEGILSSLTILNLSLVNEVIFSLDLI